jgi:lipopolysaccharide/colanic/teichoic acid biosynthesis glycosyltransferase/GGDEF domain-containing protein
MHLFSRDTRKRRLTQPLPIDPETGLYSQNFFFLRLKEERERSKRTETPFSLLTLDVGRLSAVLNGNARRSSKGNLQKDLLTKLARELRTIDIKGWLDLNTAAVLMPGTESSGARACQEKVSRMISENWPHARDLSLTEYLRVSAFGNGGSGVTESSTHASDPITGHELGEPENHLPYVYADILKRRPHSSARSRAKRIIDIIGAAVGLLIAAVPMLIVAVLVKLTSSGPVLFRQKRVGFLGRPFTFLKFRSMRAGADEAIHRSFSREFINGNGKNVNNGTKECPLYKLKKDPRITRFGHFLRRTSLDELPQLFNILRGEMSLVGPRPPIPYEVNEYKPWHSRRVLEVKPGLTGLWQVSGRSQTSFNDMVRLDLQYADNWSFWLDVKIIFKTFRAVFSAKGAY